MPISLIVHGGAHPIPPEKACAMKAGCLAAVDAGWRVLEAGGAALDAVEAAVRVLEDDANFNAGFGSALEPDGVARMDAGIMDGKRLEAGAVGSLEGVRHPIEVARRVLESNAALIVGPHARTFAQQKNCELCESQAMVSEEQKEAWLRQKKNADCDTVGCIALDEKGNIACGSSTGGLESTPAGRVGDSAQCGSGFYADNDAGAAAMTGTGEAFIRTTLARLSVEFMREKLAPEAAARRAIETMHGKTDGVGGCILMDKHGRIGWHHNETHMSVAYRTSQIPAARAFIRKQDEEQGTHVE